MTTKAPKKKPAAKPAKKPTAKKAPPADERKPVEAVLPLTDLDLSIARSVRARVDADAADRYAERYKAGEPMPPIEAVVVRGDPAAPILVGDGTHRVEGSLRAGKASITALVHTADSQQEAEQLAWAIACRANVTHGLPRTNDDLRAAVRAALLREPPASTDRHFERLLSCHRTTVLKVRVQMTEAGELTGKAAAGPERYKDSEYKQWLVGKGERPKPIDARTQVGGRAATPGDPADTPLSEFGLEEEVMIRLTLLDCHTVSELAEMLNDERAEVLLKEFGEVTCERFTAIVDGHAEKVDPSEPAGTPILAPRPLTPPVTADEITDEKGRPVPKSLASVFAARTQFRSLTQRFAALVRESEALSETPAGAAVQMNPLRTDADNVTSALAGAMPYAVCPACSGDGKVKKSPCKHCSNPGDGVGRGWVARLRYDQFTPDLKAVCEGPWGEHLEG